METKFFVRIGDQVVNADNIVSFEIELVAECRSRHGPTELLRRAEAQNAVSRARSHPATWEGAG